MARKGRIFKLARFVANVNEVLVLRVGVLLRRSYRDALLFSVIEEVDPPLEALEVRGVTPQCNAPDDGDDRWRAKIIKK